MYRNIKGDKSRRPYKKRPALSMAVSKNIWTFSLVLLIGVVKGGAQQSAVTPGTKEKLNAEWAFTKDTTALFRSGFSKAVWQPVALPHTWNVADVMDDEPGYYRGIGWYKKSIWIPASMRSMQVSLYFEGANQETVVYINGNKAGSHTGGYTSFSIPVTHLLKWNAQNEILVKVDNSHNLSIPPLTADFTFYGGIYRDVFLVTANPVHFSKNDYASQGVYITTPIVNADQATVKINGIITNNKQAAQKVKITTTLYDKKGVLVAKAQRATVLKQGTDSRFDQEQIQLKSPRLWTPEDPYLYTAVTEISEAGTGKVLDQVKNAVGFRWFRFDAAAGFFLNGKSYKLIGASRHQDYYAKGNAVTDELAIQDLKLLKEMGGNFLRVAHYPQDPAVLEACDSLGLLASVEIPVVNEITTSEAFYRNCENMQMEMIRQNFNHPSVIMWCYMNEVLLRPQFNNDKEKQKTYFQQVASLAKRLDSLTRKEDPYRYTMMAYHGDFNRYKNAGLLTIPMVVGWNLYSGWYGGTLNDFASFLDAMHKAMPDKPFVVSEYGADADPRINSFAPVRFDKSIEYTTNFHQFYLKEIRKRSFVAGGMIWNLADFNSETRTESMPHINNKGLLQWDRTPKDPYYLYQASLLSIPVLKIITARNQRTGVSDSNQLVATQSIQVASNIDSVQLFVNGRALEKTKVVNGLGSWNIPFQNGRNSIVAMGKVNDNIYTDTAVIDFKLQPYRLNSDRVNFTQINILMGANRYFTDTAQKIWLPDQPYRKDSWGSIGGTFFKMPGNNRLPYGTDKNILNTENDPVYQTQQVGIKQYRMDVPRGTYELTLHFSELLGGRVTGLAYNLVAADRTEETVNRIFSVLVNNQLILKNFNIAKDYGLATAVSKTVTISVTGDEGIVVDFQPVSGEPVLNAVELKKLN